MTKPIRKSLQSPNKFPSVGRSAANDNTTPPDNEVEKKGAVLSDANLRKPRSYIKTYEAFKLGLKLQNKIPHFKFYVPHAEDNVAITRAFPDSEILFLEETVGAKEALEKRGYDAIKGNAMVHRGENADVVVILDKNLPARWELLRNVAPGGYLLCHGDMASAVRKLGRYKFKGFIDPDEANPKLEMRIEETEVQEEEEFKKANNTETGAVTYEEARDAVKKAFGTTKNILKHYKKLIEEAKEKKGNKETDEDTIELEYTRKDGTVIKIPINTILPVRDDSKDKVFVFKKWNV